MWQRQRARLAIAIAGSALLLLSAGGPAALATAGAPGLISFERGADIWVMNPDGTGQTNLTNSATPEWRPSFSPDGTHIAYTAGLDLASAGIWVMNADGTGQTLVAPLGGPRDRVLAPSDISWSPDGTQLAHDMYVALDGAKAFFAVMVDRADGSGSVWGRAGLGFEPDWSPDGATIAFRDGDIGGGPSLSLVNAADGLDARYLASLGCAPDWSPDGTRIAFTACPSGEAAGVSVIDADGNGRTALADKGGDPSWSPDGTRIAYVVESTAIVIMNADGTGSTEVADGTHPSWGPGGPLFDFAGLLPPANGAGGVSHVNAGAVLPVKFSLGGDHGLGIFLAGSPSSKRIACGSETVAEATAQIEGAGRSSLAYNAATDVYTFSWKTDKAWAGTCRELVISLTDGTRHVARFAFR